MVIDTMVFAYSLLQVEPFKEDASRVLETAPEILVPDSLRAELCNVCWQWVAFGTASLEDALTSLAMAESLFTEAVSSSELSARALELAVEKRHPAYDTLFVALAEQRGTQVVTFDEPLARKFPELVVLATEYLHELEG